MYGGTDDCSCIPFAQVRYRRQVDVIFNIRCHIMSRHWEGKESFSWWVEEVARRGGLVKQVCKSEVRAMSLSESHLNS